MVGSGRWVESRNDHAAGACLSAGWLEPSGCSSGEPLAASSGTATLLSQAASPTEPTPPLPPGLHLRVALECRCCAGPWAGSRDRSKLLSSERGKAWVCPWREGCKAGGARGLWEPRGGGSIQPGVRRGGEARTVWGMQRRVMTFSPSLTSDPKQTLCHIPKVLFLFSPLKILYLMR